MDKQIQKTLNNYNRQWCSVQRKPSSNFILKYNIEHRFIPAYTHGLMEYQKELI